MTIVRARPILIAAGLGLVGIVVATNYWPAAKPAQPAETEKPASSKSGDKVTLSQSQMQQIAVAHVEACTFRVQKPGIGQIAFNEDASSVVQTPFSGRVTKIFAKLGDVVTRGQPLFELESPEVVQAQTDLIAAVQGLGKANSQLALANRTLERQKSLITGHATSQRDLDLAQNDFAAAEADLKTAEGALKAARNRLRVLVSRSDEEIARIEKDRVINPLITVNSPIDGTVIMRKIGPGQYVRTDANDPLFSIADLSTMWMKAAVPENDIPHIRVGQEIEVKVAALSDQVFKARVAAIGSTSDASTRRVTVRSDLPNPDGVLKGEMFATFRILAGGFDTTPAVPAEAIVFDGEGNVAWIQTGPMVFQRRKVKVGPSQDGLVQIKDGLAIGEVVAARGAVFIENEWRQ